MALDTYSDLQSSIAAWLHRSDLTSVIPDFITIAEKRIAGDLDARLMDTVAIISTVATQDYIPAPSDLLNIRSITVQSSPNQVLDYLAPDQFNTQYIYADAGTPRAYTIIGTNVYLAPIPDDIYSVEVSYQASIPALSLSGTNWLMTNYPHVYLFASLCASVMYTKDTSAIPAWEQAYKEAIESVNANDWYSGSTMVIRTDVRK